MNNLLNVNIITQARQAFAYVHLQSGGVEAGLPSVRVSAAVRVHPVSGYKRAFMLGLGGNTVYRDILGILYVNAKI